MYKLGIHPGSGWNGANWLLFLENGTNNWPQLGKFETEEEARLEAIKMVVEIVQSSHVV